MSAATLDQRFAEAMGQLVGPVFPEHVALAVSGGGDSMAMLALAQNWARVWGTRLWVVTVDHGLRPESAAEAAMVAEFCATLGRPHATLRWQWDGAGNLQDAARRARLALIDRWRQGIAHVLMAHTADDVAETFLLRLARGSGVDGLSAMQAKRRVASHPRAGHPVLGADEAIETAAPLPSDRRAAGDAAFSPHFEIIRPCLGMTRAELRQYARALNVPWVEDPGNDDPNFGRARARRLMAGLEPLGISPTGLVATARRMQRAAGALRARAASVARDLVRETFGVLLIDRAGFEDVERDTQLRLLAAACMWVSSAEYRPRSASLDDLLDRLLGGGAGTLIGAKAETGGASLLVFREYAAVETHNTATTELWDARWQVQGPHSTDLELRALGDATTGSVICRELGLPRAALMATPAVWRGAELVAAPVAGDPSEWTARIAAPFTNYLLSH